MLSLSFRDGPVSLNIRNLYGCMALNPTANMLACDKGLSRRLEHGYENETGVLLALSRPTISGLGALRPYVPVANEATARVTF